MGDTTSKGLHHAGIGTIQQPLQAERRFLDSTALFVHFWMTTFMCVHIYIYIHISLSLSLYIYIYLGLGLGGIF